MSRQVTRWTLDQKQQAAIQYAITGSLVKTCKATSIPETTLSGWKDSEEWVEMIAAVRSEKTNEHRARYSTILDLAQQQTIDKLPEATAQQAAVIGGVAFDKLRLIDNQPTTINGQSGDMKSLAKEFERLSDEMARKRNHKVINKIDEPQDKE